MKVQEHRLYRREIFIISGNLTKEYLFRSRWTLVLKNLTPQDSGKYTCHVSNKNGFINNSFEVNVYGEYKILNCLISYFKSIKNI